MPLMSGPIVPPSPLALWQAAQFSLKTFLPWTASPGLSTSGSSFAISAASSAEPASPLAKSFCARAATAASGELRRRCCFCAPSERASTVCASTSSSSTSDQLARAESFSKIASWSLPESAG
jgi:hypothetical protein